MIGRTTIVERSREAAGAGRMMCEYGILCVGRRLWERFGIAEMGLCVHTQVWGGKGVES